MTPIGARFAFAGSFDFIFESIWNFIRHAFPTVVLTAFIAEAHCQPLPASVQACRHDLNATERLRCYDDEIDKLLTMASVPAPAMPPPAMPTPPVSAPAMPTPPVSAPAMPTPPVSAPAMPTSAVSAPAVPARGVRTTAEAAPAVPAPAERASAPVQAAIVSAKIALLRFRQSGAAIITLDNGQIWTQYGPEGRVPLGPGDTVIIRPSLLGSHLLVGPAGWITKVHLIPTDGLDH
jgi:hypothetical protein